MDNRVLTYATILIAAIAIAAALKIMASVMIPFVLAIFFFYILAPLKHVLQERLLLPHPLAVTLTLLAGLLVVSGIFLLFWKTVNTVGENWSAIGARIEARLEKDVRGKPIEAILRRIGIDMDDLFGHPDDVAQDVGDTADGGRQQGDAELGDARTPSLPTTDTAARSIFDYPLFRRILAASATQFVSLLINLVLVLIFLGYLLSAREKPESPFLGEVGRTVNRYLLLKVCISVLTGLLTWGVLALIGLPFAFVFGFVAFAFNFIPSIGSFLSVVFPIPIAYVEYGFLDARFWLVILVPWALQFTLGNVIEPLIQGEGLDLHPITVLLALIFWGFLWGIPGMIIAAPLTSVIRIFLAQTEWGRPAANLLSGKI